MIKEYLIKKLGGLVLKEVKKEREAEILRFAEYLTNIYCDIIKKYEGGDIKGMKNIDFEKHLRDAQEKSVFIL